MSSTNDARERLLVAARRAFAAKGFHGTTTRDIAAAAGLSPAGVYVHHRSKEAMLFELSLAGHTALADRLQATRSAYGTATDQLAGMVRVFVESHARENDAARVINYELAALEPQHRAQVDALRRRIQELVGDVLDEGLATGEFDCGDPGMTSTAIIAMAIDVARWYDPARPWTPEAVAEHHATMALRMAGAR